MSSDRDRTAAVCPVCGFHGLEESPWEDETPSDEICPSCGTHFGYDDAAGGDAARRQQVYEQRRAPRALPFIDAGWRWDGWYLRAPGR